MATEDQNESLETLSLSNLSPVEGSRHRRKRVGIGEGSGNGKTCGKGQKGQKSRSGFSLMKGFEGGQMPIHRRLPKRGFTSRKRVFGKNVFKVISLDRLEGVAKGEDKLEIAKLFESGFLARGERLKVLGGGEIAKAMQIETHAVSASAKHAIEKAGGTVTIVSKPEKASK